ncbi:ABC transporter ATP-binding protein [Micromonospora sp. NPDC048868]|uniref:ABC transporter ATP-binding protein n=1 Tax=Micromonospora sp. NPDC048868 TaxID=3364258 RepID=UPI003722F16F
MSPRTRAARLRATPVVRLASAALAAHRGAAMLLAAITLVAASVPAGLAIASGRLVDALHHGDDRDGTARALAGLLLALTVLFLFQQALTPVAQAVAEDLGRRMNRHVCVRVLTALHRPAGVAHLEDERTGRLLAAVNGGLGGTTVRDGLVGAANMTITRLGAAGGGLVLCAYRWWLGCLVLAGHGVAMVIVSRNYQQALASAEGTPDRVRRAMYLKDALTTAGPAKEVRVFGLADWLLSSYRAEFWSALKEVRRGRGRSGLASLASGGIVLVLHVLVLVPLTLDLRAQRLSVAEFTTYAMATTALLGLATVMPDLVNIAAGGRILGAAAELERWTSTYPAAAPGVAAPLSSSGSIVFENVGFRYPQSSTWVLRHLDLTIPLGTATAVVGVNGAGKTTLVKLLCGLYQPTEGRILVDGVDLREIDTGSWQRQFAALFQDWIRWGLPVRDNVLLGAPDRAADEKTLAEVARWSGLQQVVEELPAGWSTVLSRQFDGVDLSGGQWQRVGLARALWAAAAGARILVLDEPTAALDVRGEAELYDLLLQAVSGRTIVLISHRFSTVRHADQIVVLDEGKVVERGSHASLMAAGGRYSRMFTVQAEHFVGQEAR